MPSVEALKKIRNDESFLDLPEGIGLGIRHQEHSYPVTDSFIQDDPLRSAASKQLQKLGFAPAVWNEHAGLIEVGAAMQGNLPIWPTQWGGIGFNGGFLNANLLFYRVLRPGSSDKAQGSEFAIPTSFDAAKRLPIGAEYEITGETIVQGDATIGLRAGPTMGPATAGLGLSVTADASSVRLASIRVIALDGKNKIRVIVRDLSQMVTGYSGKASLGLVLAGGGLAPAPYNGPFKYIAEREGHHSIEGLITAYTTLSAGVSMKESQQKTDILAFDFDLDKKEIEPAFQKLFHLDVRDAVKLSHDPNSGIQEVRLHEINAKRSKSESLALCAQSIVSEEVLKTSDEGDIDDHGASTVYRNTCFAQKYSSVLTNKKEVRWEQVRIHEKGSLKFDDYFHFVYSRLDQQVAQSDVNQFVAFAKELGVNLSGNFAQTMPEIPFFKKVLTKAGQVKFSLNLFFTKEGVKKIENETKNNAMKAYLTAASLLDNQFARLPLVHSDPAIREKAVYLVKLFCDYKKLPIYSSTRALMSKKLRDEYFSLTSRLIEVDEVVFRQAQEFGKQVESLKDIASRSDAYDFFSALGEAKEFDYMESILALKMIAGRENCLIHDLKIEGCGNNLSGADEGCILHPKDEAYLAMYRPET